jgi:hypothetical protein
MPHTAVLLRKLVKIPEPYRLIDSVSWQYNKANNNKQFLKKLRVTPPDFFKVHSLVMRNKQGLGYSVSPGK